MIVINIIILGGIYLFRYGELILFVIALYGLIKGDLLLLVKRTPQLYKFYLYHLILGTVSLLLVAPADPVPIFNWAFSYKLGLALMYIPRFCGLYFIWKTKNFAQQENYAATADVFKMFVPVYVLSIITSIFFNAAVQMP